MAFTYAGRYGPEQVIDTRGIPRTNTTVTVYETGTTTLATLYTDRTKATTASNPTTTSALGNLTFFANPGTYDILVSGTTLTVAVPIDPAESEEDQAADAAAWAAADASHVAAADPHTGYQKESEKAVANGYASLDADGKVPAAQLNGASGVVLAAAYGVDAASADNTAALQAADTAAAALDLPILLPAGQLTVLSTPFTARDGLRIVGQGAGVTTIVMSGNGGGAGAPFYFVGPSAATPGAPNTNLYFADFTVDAAAVTQATSKPFYASYLDRVSFHRVEVLNAPYTGFGFDHMVDGAFVDCVASGCGRLAAIGDAGASGFGIGTGEYAVENVVLIGCVGRDNTNYGVFFEQQNVANGGAPLLSTGPRVIGCYFEGNGYGVGDSGVRGLVVMGCVIEGNVRDGVIIDQGTGGGIGVPGVDGVIEGNVIRGNGRYGVFLDYRFKASGSTNARYSVRGNTIVDNTSVGVQISTDTFSIKDVAVEDNTIAGNGANGVQAAAVTTGGFTDLSVCKNRVSSNGQTNLSGYTQGIRIDCATTRLRLRGNHCYDSGSPQKQTYGIKMGVYVHTDTLITDNDLRGNLTGTLDLTGGTTFSGLSILRNNRGFNPRAKVTAPSVPASGSDYTNTTGYDCLVVVSASGGAVTAIALGGPGTAVDATGLSVASGSTGGQVVVPAGGTIRLTYTGTPSWVWFAT